MTINWVLIGFLFCLSLPGVLIAIPRVINYLLSDNSEVIKQRFRKIAVAQTLVMVAVLSFAGAILYPRTGLKAPLFEDVIQGSIDFNFFTGILLPAVLFALIGLIVFLFLYVGLLPRILDEQSLHSMTRLRRVIGVSGTILYGGVVEEVIARWGLMNLSAFFILLFVKASDLVNWSAIIISGILFIIGQIPAYTAAGCIPSRRFLYSLSLLSLSQSVIYGYLFWQYGLACAMLAHTLFHLGWAAYDAK